MPEGNSGKYPKSHKTHAACPDQAAGQHQPEASKSADLTVPHGIKKAEQQKKGAAKSSQRNTNIEVSIPYRIQKTLHT